MTKVVPSGPFSCEKTPVAVRVRGSALWPIELLPKQREQFTGSEWNS